jgi:hypothetical protein
MKAFIAFLALFTVGATAAPANGTHQFETRSQMRPKRGASFNTASQVTPMAGTIGWAYNWNHVKDGNMPSGVEYVPMLWVSDESGFRYASADGLAGHGCQPSLRMDSGRKRCHRRWCDPSSWVHDSLLLDCKKLTRTQLQ